MRSRSSTYESSFRFDNTLDANKESFLDPNSQIRHTSGLSPNISYKKHQDFNGNICTCCYKLRNDVKYLFLYFFYLVPAKSKSLGFGTFPLIRQQDRQSMEESQTGLYNTYQHNKKKQGNTSNDIIKKEGKYFVFIL